VFFGLTFNFSIGSRVPKGRGNTFFFFFKENRYAI